MTTTRWRTEARRARGVVAIAALIACACTPVAGPVDVEVVAPGDDDRYALVTRTLDSVVDLHRGQGTLFDVRAGAGLDIVGAASDDVLTASDVSALESAESSGVYQGTEVHPSLTYDPFGDRYLADDMDSLTYLTIFEGFEEVWRYFHDTIGDRSLATSRKTIIALYGDAVLSAAFPFPLPIIPKSDNAAFHPIFDFFLVMRTQDQDGVPFAMHPAMTAHEFQHRVHHWNMTAHEGVFGAWKTAASSREAQIQRAVDEGLADIFAYGHTGGDPAFLARALVDKPLSVTGLAGIGFELHARLRDLDGEFARALTYEEIVNGSDDETIRTFCGSLEGTDPLTGGAAGFNPYCLGTLVARALLETADMSHATLVDDVLPGVHAALALLAERIARVVDEGGVYDYRLEWALDAFAVSLDAERRARFCEVVGERFAPLVDEGLVAECP